MHDWELSASAFFAFYKCAWYVAVVYSWHVSCGMWLLPW